MTYESDTVVVDGKIAVNPQLNGRHVHVIVIPIDGADGVGAGQGSASASMDRMFAAAVPGIRIVPFTREEAHERG